MKNSGIGMLIFFAITIFFNIFTCKEKGKETKFIPTQFKGVFVETTEATALGGKPPIKIKIDGSSITVSDPDRDEPAIYPISKAISYENHVEFYYTDKHLDMCIRVYYKNGLFNFYDAEVLEEGFRNMEIGVFSKSL